MEGVNVYYNQMHKKWAINHSDGVEYFDNKTSAVSRGRTIAKNNGETMNLHGDEDVDSTDYSEA